MKQRMQLPKPNNVIEFTYRSRGTCAETEDATMGERSTKFIRSQGSRGTCAETEDATLLPCLFHQISRLFERHLRWNRGCNCLLLTVMHDRIVQFERHLRWNRGCNIPSSQNLLDRAEVREALALKQRMQHFNHTPRYRRYSVREALALKQRMQLNLSI